MHFLALVTQSSLSLLPPSPSSSSLPSPPPGAVHPRGVLLMAVTGWNLPGSDWGQKGQKEEKQKEKKWGCFPSSSYPGETQQASGKVYPNAFPRSWWKETQILLSSRSLCRASYLGRILYLLFWGPNYEPFRGLLSPTKLSKGRWDHLVILFHPSFPINISGKTKGLQRCDLTKKGKQDYSIQNNILWKQV